MKTLESGKDKIKEICDILRRETLEPAEKDAQRIVEEARKEAERIISDGKSEAVRLEAHAKERIAKENQVFQASLHQAGKQGLEALRQEIENRLFGEELQGAVVSASGDPALIAKLINALVSAIEKEGISADLSAEVPKAVKKSEIEELLVDHVVKRLEKEEVQVGDFAGGARVKLLDRKMTVDISDEALVELLSQYFRKDFRKYLFGE